FDYGSVRPWIRNHGEHLHSAIGGNDGLLIGCDAILERRGKHDLAGGFTVRAGDRIRTWMAWSRPELIGERPDRDAPSQASIDADLARTVDDWHRWSRAGSLSGPLGAGALRSATI